jgi:hypothetical protein
MESALLSLDCEKVTDEASKNTRKSTVDSTEFFLFGILKWLIITSGFQCYKKGYRDLI